MELHLFLFFYLKVFVFHFVYQPQFPLHFPPPTLLPTIPPPSPLSTPLYWYLEPSFWSLMLNIVSILLVEEPWRGVYCNFFNFNARKWNLLIWGGKKLWKEKRLFSGVSCIQDTSSFTLGMMNNSNARILYLSCDHQFPSSFP